MNDEPLDHEIRHGRFSRMAILAGLLLLVAVLSGLWSTIAFHLSTDAIDRSKETVVGLERLLSTVKDLETGQRGFLLTGNDDYLIPYDSARATLGAETQALSGLVTDFAALQALVADRRDAAARTIAVFRGGGPSAATETIRSGAGKAAMDRLRTFVLDEQRRADATIRTTLDRDRIVLWPFELLTAGAFLGAFAVIASLAARRRAEQRKLNGLLQGVLDHAPVGLGFLDETLHVRHMNRALSAMSDRALSAPIGASLWDVLPHLRDGLETRLKQVVEGGRPVPNIDVTAGSDRPRDYQVTFYPIRSTDRERVEGAGMVVSDVTIRKRTEMRLRESEERFRTLTQATASIVWTTSREGRLEGAQPEWAAFTGQDQPVYEGTGWLDAVHPDDRDPTLVAWQAAVATLSRFAVEHRLRRADGVWRHMDVAAVPILDDDGAIREWVGQHTDITERKLAELELSAAKDAAESANRAKSAFLANMSHELRTPLSAVIGYSEMMEEEVEDLGETGLLNDLGKIKSNARHLLSLINDVLDLSKIEANRMDTFAETIDVATLMREVAGTVEGLVKQKNNALVLELADDLGTMWTDAVKLRQCLFNLLGNAGKFTENGRITLAARRAGDGPQATLTFEVRDSGIGMNEEQLGRLFQRFSQADETTTRKFGGTGLGLAITRAFSRLLGGDIGVTSREGEGTTFTITLPATMPEITADGALPASTPTASTDHGSTVLVIDDDAAQRDLMVRFLERQGFAAMTAADGAAGLDLARRHMPRAILLDVMMPQMDGWSVLSALKAEPKLAAIPVVMVTFVDERTLSSTLGAVDLVAKPVDWDRLKAVLDRLREAEGEILVVDDDADVRERLRIVLERSGWSVGEAGDGEEALRRVMHGPPRAILLDLTMPVMDGFAFLHALRERPGCADIPVIVFSARDISAADRAQLGEADRILSKTASLKDLTGELRALAPPEGEGAEG